MAGSHLRAPARLGRYVRLLGVQLKVSLQLSLQYRFDFILGGVMALFWTAWNLVPMLLVWRQRPTVAGWTLPEALLVAAWFGLLRALLDGAIQPSLAAVVERIRLGTLDFTLLKPADAQFLLSTAKFEPSQSFDAAGAIVLMVWASAHLPHWPGPSQIALALVMTVAAAALLYSLGILVIAAAFWVVRIDNLIFVFSSVFDAARWPISIFRGFWRFLFTFIIPLGVLTTLPARALLGQLRLATVGWALLGCLVFAVGARRVWRGAIVHYTSAGG